MIFTHDISEAIISFLLITIIITEIINYSGLEYMQPQ